MKIVQLIKLIAECKRNWKLDRFKVGSGAVLSYATPKLQLASLIVDLVVKYVKNPNLGSAVVFKGSIKMANMLSEYISETWLYGDAKTSLGLNLKSSTQAYQVAIYCALCNYYERIGLDYHDVGLLTKRARNLRILAPIQYKYFLEKAMYLTGLGRNSVYYYSTGKDCILSIKRISERLRSKGEIPILVLLGGGDTNTGIIPNNKGLLDYMRSNKVLRSSLNVCDATGQWLNYWAHGDLGCDFRNKNVDMIICSLQKIEVSVDQSLLLARDYSVFEPMLDRNRRVEYLKGNTVGEKKILLQAYAPPLTSRSGAQAVAAWFYLCYYGKSGIIAKRRKILNESENIRRYIKSRKEIEYVHCENNTIAFRCRKGEANLNLVKMCEANGICTLGYSPTLCAKNISDYGRAEKGESTYSGIFGSLMEKQCATKIIKSLEKVIKKVAAVEAAII